MDGIDVNEMLCLLRLFNSIHYILSSIFSNHSIGYMCNLFLLNLHASQVCLYSPAQDNGMLSLVVPSSNTHQLTPNRNNSPVVSYCYM
jgi:hypothetical protein